MPPQRSRSPKTVKPLTAHIAVVAGATRGAGRGIARALAEAGGDGLLYGPQCSREYLAIQAARNHR